MKCWAILLLLPLLAGCLPDSPAPVVTSESVKDLTARLLRLETALQDQSNTVGHIVNFDDHQIGIDESHDKMLELLRDQIDIQQAEIEQLQRLVIRKPGN